MLHSSIRSSRSRSSSFERPLSHYCWKFYSTFVPPTQPLPLIVFVLFRPASFVLCPPRQLTSLRFRLQIFLITFLPRRVPFDFSEEAEAGETFPTPWTLLCFSCSFWFSCHSRTWQVSPLSRPAGNLMTPSSTG